ncbi:MAG: hypothetical protein QW728_00875 [Thermoplasmata archaeon]
MNKRTGIYIAATSLLASAFFSIVYLIFPPVILFTLLTNPAYLIGGIVLFVINRNDKRIESEKNRFFKAGIILIIAGAGLAILSPFIFGLGTLSVAAGVAGALLGVIGYSCKGFSAISYLQALSSVKIGKKISIALIAFILQALVVIIMCVIIINPVIETARNLGSVGTDVPTADKLAEWIAEPLLKFLTFRILFAPSYILTASGLFVSGLRLYPSKSGEIRNNIDKMPEKKDTNNTGDNQTPATNEKYKENAQTEDWE